MKGLHPVELHPHRTSPAVFVSQAGIFREWFPKLERGFGHGTWRLAILIAFSLSVPVLRVGFCATFVMLVFCNAYLAHVIGENRFAAIRFTPILPEVVFRTVRRRLIRLLSYFSIFASLVWHLVYCGYALYTQGSPGIADFTDEFIFVMLLFTLGLPGLCISIIFVVTASIGCWLDKGRRGTLLLFGAMLLMDIPTYWGTFYLIESGLNTQVVLASCLWLAIWLTGMNWAVTFSRKRVAEAILFRH